MRSSAAIERTAASVRPSFRPITLVGVFCRASSRNEVLSPFDQLVPLFRFDFAIGLLPARNSSETEPRARVPAPSLSRLVRVYLPTPSIWAGLGHDMGERRQQDLRDVRCRPPG